MPRPVVGDRALAEADAADARADQPQVDGDLLVKDTGIVSAALNGADAS